MRISVTMLCTDRSIGPAELAREVEAHGLDGLYLPEHTHIPTSRATPAPMGEPLPDAYSRLLDPFVALTAAAAATERIRIGTGVCLVAARDPIITAKEVATLDLLSGGRFVFGVGFGWNREELADHGVPFPHRRAMTREKVLAMRRLWADDVALFDGEWVTFDKTWSWPKPLQQPHPPVLLGIAAGEQNVAHLVEYADGWIPIGGSGLRSALPLLRAALADAGRDPDRFDVMPFGSTPDPAKFAYFAELGVSEVVVNLPSGPRDDVLPVIEHAASVAAALH